MYKFKQSLLAFACLLALVAAVALLTPRTGLGQKPTPIPPAQNVNVVNTPLPVTGTVSVANLGSNPLPVRDVDNPARQPFTFRSAGLAFGGGANTSASFVAPAGKRLVVEQVSVAIFLREPSANQNATFNVRTTVAGTETAYSAVGGDFGTFVGVSGPVQFFRLSSQMRSYADPETTVSIDVSLLRLSNSSNDSATVNLSGYLVDVPTPAP